METLHERHAQWIEARGLNVELARQLGIYTKQEGGKNWLSVPYVEEGRVLNHKYRFTGEKRHKMDRGAPLILWNHDVLLQDSVKNGQQEIIITEGEWDAVAAIQCGFQFTVSVPNGAPEKPTDLPHDTESDAERYRFIWRAKSHLDQVCSFILAVDGDEAGIALAADLARRLGPERCKFVAYPDDCKDLNEVLEKHGEAEVVRILNSARAYPIKGIYQFSDFPEPPPIMAISLALPVHDDCIKMVPGTLTVWTGFAGAGKTSLLMFLIANLLHAGVNIAMGSFETAVRPILHQKLIEALCSSVRSNITYDDLRRAEAILAKRFFIIAQDSDDPDHELTLEETLELARISVFRDGVRLFIIDPWNELEHKRGRDENEAEYTGRAIRAWKAFAKAYKCAVWIVAHPKKPGEFGRSANAPGLYDISGSAHWANKADYGVVIHRPDPSLPITEMTVVKVRMGLPGRTQGIRMSYDRAHARYLSA